MKENSIRTYESYISDKIVYEFALIALNGKHDKVLMGN